MKRSMLLLGMAVLCLLIIFQSCKKDDMSDFETIQPAGNSQSLDMGAYDDFGPGLEKAVDRAIKNEDFKKALIELTQERPTGDFEVLLSSLLDYNSNGNSSIKDILLESANGAFDKKALDKFMDQYPSLILATRGSILSWVNEEHIPPVVFVPSDFNEADISINGTQDGQSTPIKLNQKPEDAIIAIHISERHDKFGNMIVIDHTANLASGASTFPTPGVDLSGEVGAGLRNCDPEPSECWAPEVEFFEVTDFNGGIKIEYEVANFPAGLCHYGRVIITREGPPDEFGEVVVETIVRHADEPRIFYDVTVAPQTTYIYRIYARVQIIHEDGVMNEHGSQYLICPGETVEHEPVTTSEALPIMGYFEGSNVNNDKIFYDWAPPGGPVNQYRLRLKESSGYSNVVVKYANEDTDYWYTHSPAVRGTKVEMQIQYRESGPWGGDFFDRSYASHRDPHQPLFYYGVHMPNSELYELSEAGDISGENILFGAPEIRLLAVRGANSVDGKATIPVQQTVIFTTSCGEPERGRGGEFVLVPSDIYIPMSGQPVHILQDWDNDLIGSAISVKLTETDVADVIITEETHENSHSLAISAEYGFKVGIKIPGIGGAQSEITIGVETEWESATEKEFRYPDGDIDMDYFTIYYHYEHILRHCGGTCNLYGYLYTEEQGELGYNCELVEEYLDE